MTLPVEDVVAIQQLAARYNHLIDSGAHEEWAQLFTEDAVFDAGANAAFEGREQLLEFARTLPEYMPGIRHVVTNLWIDGDGDRATMRSYLNAYLSAADPDQATPLSTGVYHDELVRVDGQWRFASRRLVPDGR